MSSGENWIKVFLAFALVGSVGLFLLTAPNPSSINSVLPAASAPISTPIIAREKSTQVKIIDGNSCYQYLQDPRWFMTSKEGVELLWDDSLRCFRIDGKLENGTTVAHNPDGKLFELKAGKWRYHHVITDIDWRIDPQGLYDLKEEHGRHITEHGRVLIRTFRGWVVDDGPRVGSQRLQWWVDVNGYYLKSSFNRDRYQGVVLPNGLEIRWKDKNLKSLEFLSFSRGSSEITWIPQPLGQLSNLFKTSPQNLYAQLIQENHSPEMNALVATLSSAMNRDQFRNEIERTFQVSIQAPSTAPLTPQFLICVALALDCYPRERLPLFIKSIQCNELHEWAGLAHARERCIEVAPLKAMSPFLIGYLLRTLHHELSHNISLVPELRFDWNGFRALNAQFRYRNVYNANSGSDPKQCEDTATDYGRTNEYEDVATIAEFCMTDPADLSTHKSDYFKRKYFFITQFYNALFGFHFNPDYLKNSTYESSISKWDRVSDLAPDLPEIRLD